MAGVSTATVSRFVNSDARVETDTAARVEEAIGALGYRVNFMARGLKTRSSRTIGAMAPELANDFFMGVIESMERELMAGGYSLIVCSSGGSEAEERRRLKSLADRMVDGIAVIPSAHSRAALESLCGVGLPFVLLDRRIEGLEADAVLVDNEGGARAATAALIADGHRRIGFLGGPMDVSTAAERYRGYERALREAGIAADPRFESFAGLDIASGYRMMGEMASRPGGPEAFFIVNSFVHVGATNYLLTKGAPGTERIVFASFDETDYAPLLRFCRYSVAQPIGAIGAAAARSLLGRIGGTGDKGPRVERLETTLIRHETGAKGTASGL